MATNQNKPEDVRELQEYLRRLSATYPRIPLLAVDGIYGSETTEAVRIFQDLFGLPVTGDVDQTTWERVVAEYTLLTDRERPGEPIYPFLRIDGDLEPGDQGSQVVILQAMLDTIASYYNNLLRVTATGRYDAATTEAVQRLQGVFGLETTGRVDRRTWDLLARTYNVYVDR